MCKYLQYGLDDDDETAYPKFENFRWRALRLANAGILRLCEHCLRNRRRCMDSRKVVKNATRSWKSYRRMQYRT